MTILDGHISWQATAAISAAACFTSAALASFALKAKSETPIKKPQKWVRVGTVSELVIYPVKSFHGTQVREATVTRLGLTAGNLLRDRVFMVIDQNGGYQVQMKHPKLAVIEFSNVGNKITLKAPETPDITFDLPQDTGTNRRSCRIFLEKGLMALDCGDAVASWIQRFIGMSGLRLVYHNATKTQRTLSDFQKKFPLTSPEDLATFQNYTSYLLIGEESIQELNKHVSSPVSAKNFRPSILVSGIPEPFAEIRWGFVRIGENTILKASKPCERCKITTVNQETGIQDPDGEPLKTLTKIRPEFDDKEVEELLKTRGIMGLQMGLSKNSVEGATIKVGDPVYAALL